MPISQIVFNFLFNLKDKNILFFPFFYIYNNFYGNNAGSIINSGSKDSFGLDIIFGSFFEVSSFFIFLFTSMVDCIILVVMYFAILHIILFIQKLFLPVHNMTIMEFNIQETKNTQELLKINSSQNSLQNLSQETKYELMFDVNNRQYSFPINENEYNILNHTKQFVLLYKNGTRFFINGIKI